MVQFPGVYIYLPKTTIHLYVLRAVLAFVDAIFINSEHILEGIVSFVVEFALKWEVLGNI